MYKVITIDDYKMNRSFVSKYTFKKADNHVTYFVKKTPQERLNYACDIINSIYNSSPDHKVDRTIISSRKHAESI